MKKTTISIGIPAYNEEQNIELFLRSIFKQNFKKIELKEIIVNSDASSDRTNEIVQKLCKTYPVIKLNRGTERKGKYFRVNELFKKVNSDILIILDADIAFGNTLFLETIVNSLISNKEAVMMAANITLIRPQKFFPKILHTTFILGDMMRLSVPGYDIAANFHGAATAYKKSFIKKTYIPSKLSDPHLYIYLAAKKQNGFSYCPEAVILQIPPSTMQDVRHLMKRSIGKRDSRLEKLFGRKMLEETNTISIRYKLIGLWKCFLMYPLYTPLAVIMNYYLARIAVHEKKDSSPIWDVNTSTKKAISYAKR